MSDGELIARSRRRLWIAAAIAALAIGGIAAWLIVDRRHARARARDQVLAAAKALDACLVGPDVADADVAHALLVRALDQKSSDVRACFQGTANTIASLDPDELPDALASIVRSMRGYMPLGGTRLEDACDQVDDLRRAVAAVEERAAPRIACMPAPSGARVFEHPHGTIAVSIDGELLDIVTNDQPLMLHRYDASGAIVAEVQVVDRFAVDGGDVVYDDAERTRLWRDGVTVDGPPLGAGFGTIRAWRREGAGGVGVFWAPGDHFMVQRFDGTMHAVGAPRELPYRDRFGHVAFDDHGTIALNEVIGGEGPQHRIHTVLTPDAKTAQTWDDVVTGGPGPYDTCAAPRTVWSVVGGSVAAAPIDRAPQELAGLRWPALALACTDEHLFVAGAHGLTVCGRAECAYTRQLPMTIHGADVRAVGAGGEAVFDVDLEGERRLLVVRAPFYDGHFSVDAFEHVDLDVPFAYDGHWFLMRRTEP
ncbi:MAG TPA: hypothetical protein VL463_07245 [Kofleriaceae bacterium]|nr:hypothetical protein [Kofleriaceae bacterium]